MWYVKSDHRNLRSGYRNNWLTRIRLLICRLQGYFIKELHLLKSFKTWNILPINDIDNNAPLKIPDSLNTNLLNVWIELIQQQLNSTDESQNNSNWKVIFYYRGLDLDYITLKLLNDEYLIIRRPPNIESGANSSHQIHPSHT